MLKIQVTGKGLIPRGYGLAPRLEFFKADLTLISTILLTPGLKVNMLSPEDNKIIPVTNANVRMLWDKYRSDKYESKETKPSGDTIVRSEAERVIPETPTVVKSDESATKTEEVPTGLVKAEKDTDKNDETPTVVKSDESATKTEEVPEDKEDKAASNAIKPILNNNDDKNKNKNHYKK